MATRKTPQHNVDRARAQMSPEDRGDFDHFVQFNPSYSDIQRRLKELGFEISMSAVQSWYVATRPIGAQATYINDLAKDYAGTDPYAVLQMSMTIAAKLADDLLQVACQKLDAASPENVLHTLTVLLKEQRTCAVVLNRLQTNRDRKSLELAGGYRTIEILLNHARDTAHEAIIREYCDAAIAQLEQEVGGGND